MATTAQKKSFINMIAPIAQKAYKQCGKPLPSICIAMAAVESNWGLAGSCKYNSYMGQKVGTGKTATKYWSGDYFNAKTQEVTNQSTGQLTTIRDNFRAYDSVEQCIFNYYELLNTSLYKKVLAGSGYEEQMKQIKACGYMTSVTEVNTCLSIISQNNLTQYDEQDSGIVNYSLVKDGSKQISANFKVREFACKDGSDTILVDVDFVRNYLQKIREHFGVPITINSGYRTSTYNTKVGGAKNSYHMKGQAFDIVVNGHTPNEVAKYAKSLGIKGIIQYNSFVHVDSRETKYWAKNNNGSVTVVSNF